MKLLIVAVFIVGCVIARPSDDSSGDAPADGDASAVSDDDTAPTVLASDVAQSAPAAAAQSSPHYEDGVCGQFQHKFAEWEKTATEDPEGAKCACHGKTHVIKGTKEGDNAIDLLGEDWHTLVQQVAKKGNESAVEPSCKVRGYLTPLQTCMVNGDVGGALTILKKIQPLEKHGCDYICDANKAFCQSSKDLVPVIKNISEICQFDPLINLIEVSVSPVAKAVFKAMPDCFGNVDMKEKKKKN